MVRRVFTWNAITGISITDVSNFRISGAFANKFTSVSAKLLREKNKYILKKKKYKYKKVKKTERYFICSYSKKYINPFHIKYQNCHLCYLWKVDTAYLRVTFDTHNDYHHYTLIPYQRSQSPC